MIFISYKSEESAQAEAVRGLLEANGIPCWMAPDSLEPGKEYGQQITEAIRGCDALVLLLTEAAQGSNFVLSEIDLAMTFKKDIVPLHLDTVELNDAFLFRIAVVQRIEAAGRVEEACQDLVARLRKVFAEQDEARAVEEPVASVVVPAGVTEVLEQVQEARESQDGEPLAAEKGSFDLLRPRLHLIGGTILAVAFVLVAQVDPEAERPITYITLFGSAIELGIALLLAIYRGLRSAAQRFGNAAQRFGK